MSWAAHHTERTSRWGGRLLPLALVLAAAAAPAQTPTPSAGGPVPEAKELLRRMDELYESSGTMAEVEIEIVKPGRTRTLRLKNWSRGEEKALIVIEAPARDAGTATLKVGDNLWNYLPKISRTIRIPPSMMMGSWMGTDLTNDDLVRESSYEEDYTSELVGRSADPPGWEVRLDARAGIAGLWDRVEIVFSFEDRLPVEARFYDRKGRWARTMHFEDARRMGGRLIPSRITIVPEGEEGQRTIMQYITVEFNVDLDEGMFSLSRLERKR